MISTNLIVFVFGVLGIIISIVSLYLTIRLKYKKPTILEIRDQRKVLAQIIEQKPKFVYLVGVSLNNVLFKNNFLENLISLGDIKINILLLDPNSEGANQLYINEFRFKETKEGKDIEQLQNVFKHEILNSIAMLRNFESFNKNITLRLYKGFPTTFMCVTNEICVVQPYNIPAFRQINVYKSPMIIVNKKSEESLSIYESMYKYYLNMWDNSKVISS